jgi:hypothetical protein
MPRSRQRTAQEKARRQARDAARRAAPLAAPAGAQEGAQETMAEPRYWCRWPSGFIYNGTPLDQGQVFALGGCRNDEQLIRLRYIMPLEGTPRLATCGVCGAQFMDDARREGHGRKRHSGRPEAPSGVPAGAGLAAEDRSSAAADRLNEAALRGEV